MVMSPNRETQRDLYYNMQRVRQLQLAIEAEYHLDQMKTPVHLCVGQEAIPVGVCAQLGPNDYISSNHRGHGHYLAKGGDLKALVAELFCRKTGCSEGRGGSMHLVDPAVGHLGSSSIVGGGISIGVGMALASQYLYQNRVSVTFFGDGAADEGTLYESVNFAMLKRLPVIFVLENNRYSVCSPVANRQAAPSLFHQAPSDLLASHCVDGNDVLEIYQAAGQAIAKAREGKGPSFIECLTYRMRGHAGAGHDAALGYRDLEEIKSWEKRDPITRLERSLLHQGILAPGEADAMVAEISAEIKQAFDLAKEAPLPTAQDLHHHLFCEA